MSEEGQTPAASTARTLHEQTVSRLNNQAAQVALGFEAHPYSYDQTHHTRDLLAAHPCLLYTSPSPRD